jgi:hypothetical protein
MNHKPGAIDRIDDHIDLQTCPGSDHFAAIQRGMFAEATLFSDNDFAVHFDAGKGLGHGVSRVVVGSFRITKTYPPASSHGGRLGYP